MSKQILSEEFRRMQKLAGIINENYDNYFDTSHIDNWEKGGGPDEEEEFEAHFEKRTYNGKERTFLVDEFGEEHSNFTIVNTPDAEKELKMYKMNTGSRVTGVFNVNMGGVQTKVLTYPERSDKPEMYENLNEYVDSVRMMGLNENQNKVYGIEKDYEPYDFGPYTKEEAEAKAEEYHKKDSFSIYKVELYNSMHNKLTGIDRMHTPRLDANGNFMDLDQPFSSGDLADY
jgi:hypothetical protein